MHHNRLNTTPYCDLFSYPPFDCIHFRADLPCLTEQHNCTADRTVLELHEVRIRTVQMNKYKVIHAYVQYAIDTRYNTICYNPVPVIMLKLIIIRIKDETIEASVISNVLCHSDTHTHN